MKSLPLRHLSQIQSFLLLISYHMWAHPGRILQVSVIEKSPFDRAWWVTCEIYFINKTPVPKLDVEQIQCYVKSCSAREKLTLDEESITDGVILPTHSFYSTSTEAQSAIWLMGSMPGPKSRSPDSPFTVHPSSHNICFSCWAANSTGPGTPSILFT